jgi:hypothetical protein
MVQFFSQLGEMGVRDTEESATESPSKTSAWLDKWTAKSPISQDGDEALLLKRTATTASTASNVVGDDEDSIRSKQWRPSSILTTGSDMLSEKPTPEEMVGSSSKGEDKSYISGFPLFSVMAGITLSSFLMLLDVTIISTVSSLFQDGLHIPAADHIRLYA